MRKVPALKSVTDLQLWFIQDAEPQQKQLIARPYDETSHYLSLTDKQKTR